jgi:uncharacterized protein (DUF2344 family)
MSKLNIYSIRDKKAEAYMKPFFLPQDGLAIRAIKESLMEQNQLSMHAADFCLYRIGQFDEESGSIENCLPQYISEVSAIQTAMIQESMQKQQSIQSQEEPVNHDNDDS